MLTEGVMGSFETRDVEQIMRTINEAYEQYKMADAELEYCDKKTQDILHELELVNHKYHETAKLSLELTDIRRRRRVAKDTLELLYPIVHWRDQQQGALGKLSNVIGEMRKIDEKHRNAVYYYRADGDKAGNRIEG